VDVTVAADNGRVRIVVADTGIGMTEEDAARLFNDFVRIRNARTKDILGSGLGLSTVRKLAHMYGGEARVTSRPDEGSTFSVELARRDKPRERDHGTV
jgi:signal transduction histidine kinase